MFRGKKPGVLITVDVKPSSKESSIVEQGPRHYIVKVHAPAYGGKANKETQTVLSSFFHIAKSCVVLERGAKNKRKVFRLIQARPLT